MLPSSPSNHVPSSGNSTTGSKKTRSKTSLSDKGGSINGRNSTVWATTYLYLLILVIVFFGAGIYVGSILVGADVSVQAKDKMLSLPKVNYLRKEQSKSSNSESSEKNPFRPPGNHLAPALTAESEENLAKEAKLSQLAPATIPLSSDILDKSFSLHAEEQSYFVGPRSLDNKNILVGAWIYLDSNAIDNDMRTIFSNKAPGCEPNEEQNGIAMFVNAWQTSDHKLYVEYGGQSSGCNKIDSKDTLLIPLRWYHVALYLGPAFAVLFVDGVEVNRQAVTDEHKVQTNNPLQVGRYFAGASYPLFGNVSGLAVVHGQPTQELEELPAVVDKLQQPITARELPGLVAFYPLSEGSIQKSHTKAHNIIGSSHGELMFPLYGNSVAGVNVPLIDGLDGVEITDEMRQESDKKGRIRREKIKDAMRHLWSGYKQFAWGMDELKPLSKQGQNNWGGMGMTLVDSLDTLWVMGLKEEFKEARDWVERSLSFDRAGQVSVFETTIRALGGLLSAYDLSGDDVFLGKAQILGDKLIGAFHTSSGIPTGMVQMRTGAPAQGWSGNQAILSELGTLQIEFRYLSQATKKTSYEKIAMKPVQLMAKKTPAAGLYPIKVDIDSGGFAENTITFGALGDSFYEYLLKVWIQGGKKEKWLRDLYDKAMNGAIEKLLQVSSPSGLAFLSDWNGRSNFRKMDHLVCFMPGLLTLGAVNDPNGGLQSPRAQRDLAVARALMYTCREMYHRQRTGIAPEYVDFPVGKDMTVPGNAPFYILRPETAESLFIMNQLTGDPIYREWAWEIFEAIEKNCRTSAAYATLRDVDRGGQDDRMESFFPAETMKYLYLAQDPDMPIDLSKYVFNTEAHPMKIFDDSHIPIEK